MFWGRDGVVIRSKLAVVMVEWMGQKVVKVSGGCGGFIVRISRISRR